MTFFRSKTTDNQTEFGHVAPIMDTSLEDAWALKIQRDRALQPKIVWFKRPKIIAFIFLVVLLLAVGLSVFISSMAPQSPTPKPLSPTPTPVPYQTDITLIEQINLVKKDLEKLDFQEANLALPQIDRDISITINQ